MNYFKSLGISSLFDVYFSQCLREVALVHFFFVIVQTVEVGEIFRFVLELYFAAFVVYEVVDKILSAQLRLVLFLVLVFLSFRFEKIRHIVYSRVGGCGLSLLFLLFLIVRY